MNHTWRRSIGYSLLLAALAFCSFSIGHGSWRGNTELHTLLETISTLLALVGSAVAIMRYHTRKTVTYLLLGSGLLGATLLDGYHAVITSSFLAGRTPSSLDAIAAWSGVTPRVFLALLLFLHSLESRNEAQGRLVRRVGERGVHAWVGAFTLACFLIFTFVPLPPALYPDAILNRPVDLIPAVFFGLAALQHLRKGAWKTNSFEHWFILSLIASMSSHLFYLPFSAALLDGRFCAAHLLTMLSFALILAGLLSRTFSTFRSEVESVAQLRRANESLSQEVEERQTAEDALLRTQRDLEARVEARTADLAEQGRLLRSAHAEIELFLASIPSILIGTDAQGKITRWNPTASRVFGIPDRDALGRTLDGLGIQWLHSDIGAEVARWLDTETLRRCEDLAYEKDGKTRSVGLTIRPIDSPQKGAAGFIITGADITERKDAEAAVSFLAAIVESTEASIIGVDPNGLILSWNRGAERMYGYSSEEVRGRPVSLCWPPESKPELADILANLSQLEGGANIESARLRKDGERIPVLVSYSPIRDASGKVVSYCSIAVDITERKLLERQLYQAQKLESIGQLAAGIAHEINTPIQYVGDNTRFLQDSFAKLDELLSVYERLLESVLGGTPSAPLAADVQALAAATRLSYIRSEIPQSIQDSLEGVSRVAEIVKAIKDFSHPGPLEKTAVDLNHAIESTILVSRNEWKYVAELQADLDPDLPPTQCVAGEFNQVVLNLIVNAAHAIADVVAEEPGTKGTIRVSTRRVGDWAEIRVRDTGTGIPEVARPNVFNPFFTTKAVGKGTGQGLSIAHTVIVQKHGGTIGFETEMGVGTTFIVRIPIGDEHQEPHQASWDATSLEATPEYD